MDLLLHYGGKGPMVTVQLCLAFAALVAHVPSSQWGQGGVLQWLVKKMEGQDPETSIPVMLEMLTILPEVRFSCFLAHVIGHCFDFYWKWAEFLNCEGAIIAEPVHQLYYLQSISLAVPGAVMVRSTQDNEPLK